MVPHWYAENRSSSLSSEPERKLALRQNSCDNVAADRDDAIPPAVKPIAAPVAVPVADRPAISPARRRPFSRTWSTTIADAVRLAPRRTPPAARVNVDKGRRTPGTTTCPVARVRGILA